MKALASLALLVTLAACATAPAAPPRPAPMVPPARLAEAAPIDVAPDPAWWRQWQDRALDAQIERALAGNADLRIATARLRAARAMVGVAESALWPTIAADGAAFVGEGSAGIDGALGQILAASPGATVPGRSGGHVVALGAAWEPDVFGGRHADRDTAQALALGAEAMVAGTRLMIAADVAENWLQAAGLSRRLALLDQSLACADDLIAYARARMAAGQADATAVASAQALRADLAAGRPALVELIAIRTRRIAVLSGDLPETAVAVGAGSAQALPSLPAGVLPDSVLARRPDVRAAQAGVAAAAAHLRSLHADLHPRFGLVLGGADGRLALTGLPGYGGQVGLLGLSASVPLFTAGRLRARIAGGDAALDAALALADRATLTALEDVEAALGLRHGADAAQQARLAAQQADEARLAAAQALWRAGRQRRDDVLQARLAALRAADAVEQARMAQASASVQLFRALGGGVIPDLDEPRSSRSGISPRGV